MEEPTYLMQQQPFSYVASIPNQSSNEGNPIHGLGQSISFGRFMSESLAWEKWSSFSHNRYVEEAERFSRPGSVAQKKVFFEAHYKNYAARKAAAALLEQVNAAANNVPIVPKNNEGEVQDSQVDDKEIINIEASSIPDDKEHNLLVEMQKSESKKVGEVDLLTENQDAVNVESLSQFGVSENKGKAKEIELNGTKLMEKPLLKDFVSNKDDLTSINKKKQQVSAKTSKLPCSPAKSATSLRAKRENHATPISKKSAIDSVYRKKSTPKSSHKSMNFTPVREINRITSSIIRKIDNSQVGSNYKPSRDYSTPLKTPTTVSVFKEPKLSLVAPQSEDRRARTPLHPSATGRSKWHLLPTDCSKFMGSCKNKSQSPNISTPFNFRTEEKAERRKKRLEEKLNANQSQKLQLQATLKKAEEELKRLRQSLCFKARPLPDFYKERATAKNPIEKVPLTHQSPDLGRSATLQSTSQPSKRSLIKNGGPKHVVGKNSDKSRSITLRLRSITRENTSPNIQHGQHKMRK